MRTLNCLCYIKYLRKYMCKAREIGSEYLKNSFFHVFSLCFRVLFPFPLIYFFILGHQHKSKRKAPQRRPRCVASDFYHISLGHSTTAKK